MGQQRFRQSRRRVRRVHAHLAEEGRRLFLNLRVRVAEGPAEDGEGRFRRRTANARQSKGRQHGRLGVVILQQLVEWFKLGGELPVFLYLHVFHPLQHVKERLKFALLQGGLVTVEDRFARRSGVGQADPAQVFQDGLDGRQEADTYFLGEVSAQQRRHGVGDLPVLRIE